MEVRELVRKETLANLKKQGIKGNGKMLKGDKLKHALHSLFFRRYKENLTNSNKKNIQLNYADMLEVIRTLIIKSKADINEFNINENQTLQWYKSASPSKKKLLQARIDLLQKFDELLGMETEAEKDQVKDVFNSFKNLVEEHGFSFASIEQTRRMLNEKLGGYVNNKGEGVFLESATKTRLKTITYSV